MNQAEKCFAGEREVPCPGQEQQLESEQSTVFLDRRILPENFIKNERDNVVFGSILVGVITITLALIILKIKIFGRTLIEYIKPIWFYVLGAIIIVLSQYLIGLPYGQEIPYFVKVTQALWALMVALSVVKFSKEKKFSLGNAFFLGVIYSVIIHGLKVTIRYLFYEKTLAYIADRFIYGSLMVMVIVVILGPLFVFLKPPPPDQLH